MVLPPQSCSMVKMLSCLYSIKRHLEAPKMYRLGTTRQLTVENIDATGAPRLMRRVFRKLSLGNIKPQKASNSVQH